MEISDVIVVKINAEAQSVRDNRERLERKYDSIVCKYPLFPSWCSSGHSLNN